MEFKPLDIKPEGNFFKRMYRSAHVRRSALYILIGALLGLGYYYFSEGRHMNTFELGSMARSMFLGGFMGFFITNSPCARGKC